LREISGEDVTAKDFRTWGGTLLAAQGLLEAGCSDDPREAASHVVTAIKRVAAQLGNTPAVCRACYVHPSVIEAYLAGAPLTPARSHATLEETDLIAFLRSYAAGLAEAS
jgi:DNA topoisomerase-1